MTKPMNTTLKYASVAMIGVSIFIFGYLWSELGARGIYADETGTSGYITKSEVFLILFSFTLFFTGMIAYIKSVKKR